MGIKVKSICDRCGTEHDIDMKESRVNIGMQHGHLSIYIKKVFNCYLHGEFVLCEECRKEYATLCDLADRVGNQSRWRYLKNEEPLDNILARLTRAQLKEKKKSKGKQK